jgi:hypothetical protein
MPERNHPPPSLDLLDPPTKNLPRLPGVPPDLKRRPQELLEDPDIGEVLGPEPRLGAPGPDAFDPDRRPRLSGQGGGGAQNLPTPLAVRTVQREH